MLPRCANCGALMRLQDESARLFQYRCATCHSKRTEHKADGPR
ncbi:hypothetical protein [Halostella litorea]|nr:hypothetical protein [Halostella litorea]